MKYNIISDAVSPLRVLCRKICIGVLAVGFTIFGTSCDDDDNNTFDYGSLTPPAAVYSPEVTQTMQNLWTTSSALDDKDSRTAAYAAIQGWADDCPADEIYMRYRDADTPLALAIQNIYPALQCYDMAFDRVLNALKAGMPADGKPRVWALYNMGIVVQTASGNYAVDIYHRRGAELAPYIDFYAITHVHADHKWEPLARAMSEAGKPVLTNFAIPGVNNSAYLSTEEKDYTLGSFKIHSFITHHNSSPLTTLAITAFFVEGGGVSILHSGDSNFIAEEFESMRGRRVDFYVFRYAVNALTENNVLGNVVTPKVAVLSHILELGHKDVASSRWSLQLGLERAARLNSDNVVMPFWGDALTL